jgi:hypothetical protein
MTQSGHSELLVQNPVFCRHGCRNEEGEGALVATGFHAEYEAAAGA